MIFADVALRPEDDPVALVAAGLPLRQRGQRQVFSQPCAALRGCQCCLYAQRPQRCRAFDCRLLLRVQGGEVTPASALKTIARALREVAVIQRLLVQLGQADEHLPLSRRYREVMRQPMDLSGGEKIPRLRGRLMSAVGRLAEVLQRDFLT